MEQNWYVKGGTLPPGWDWQPIGPHKSQAVADEERELLRRAEESIGRSRLTPGILWGLDYIDRTYGTRRSRGKRHLRAAWRELRAAVAEYRR